MSKAPKTSCIYLPHSERNPAMFYVDQRCNMRRTVLAEHSKSAVIRRRLAPSSRILRIASTCPGLNFRGGPRTFPSSQARSSPSLVRRLLVPLGSRRVGGDVGTMRRLPAHGGQPFQGGRFDGGFGDSGHGVKSWAGAFEAVSRRIRSRCVSIRNVPKVASAPTASLACLGWMPMNRPSRPCVGCQRFWTVLGPRDWGEEAPGLRVSLTS